MPSPTTTVYPVDVLCDNFWVSSCLYWVVFFLIDTSVRCGSENLTGARWWNCTAQHCGTYRKKWLCLP